jgi:hypothetical protein
MLRILCFLLLPHWLLAQSDWIDAGRIQAQIGGTGLRSLLMPAADTLAAPLQGIRHLGLWIGGLDPAGNLKLAVDTGPDTAGDFTHGFRGIPGSDRIWKVTADEILAHRNDWAADGDIDDTIPAIFAWPAYGNPYSMQYNGFELDMENRGAVSYNDLDANAQYNPGFGESPNARLRGTYPQRIFPSEIVFTPFYSVDVFEPGTGWKGVPFDGSLTALTYSCNHGMFSQTSIYFIYRLQYYGSEWLDSTYVGVYWDPDIGNAENDYVGADISSCHPSIFAYNADTIADPAFGHNPPVLSLNFFTTPLDTFGQAIKLRHMMPVFDPSVTIPSGAWEPEDPLEFYRQLTGYWPDGTPLSEGGLGYHPNLPNLTSQPIAYPNRPTLVNGWSELNDANPPANRKVIASIGPVTMLPGAINEVSFAISFIREASFSSSLDAIEDYRRWQAQTLGYDLYDPTNLTDSLCFSLWLQSSTHDDLGNINLYPNPASQVLHWDIPENTPVVRAFVLNAAGQMVYHSRQPALEHLDIAQLDNGVYFLRLETAEGRVFHGRFVVLR